MSKKLIIGIFILLSGVKTALAYDISSLPQELQLLILTKADIADIARYCRISIYTNNLCTKNERTLWSALVKRDFGEEINAPEGDLTWKGLYKILDSNRAKKYLSLGPDHTCAIKADGAAQCWGDDRYGQSTVPVDLGKAIAISAGIHRTCAIKDNGVAQCWGSKSLGNLGKVIATADSLFITYIIKDDGTVESWNNDNGRREITTVPSDLGAAIAIAARHDHACAIKTDETVQCWGDPRYGKTTVPSDLGKVKTR